MQRPFNHIRFPGWILILILIQNHFIVRAQSTLIPLRHDVVVFEHLGEDHGINNHISAIFEDHLRYIWFACGYEGLYRCDGYEFEFYEHQLDDFDSRIKGLETGADDYILKPFHIKELKTRIHNLIHQRNLLRERFIRLKRAVKMLEENQAPITHVAFEVGFGNLSYFTKCFKEEFGISPSEYSKQYK